MTIETRAAPDVDFAQVESAVNKTLGAEGLPASKLRQLAADAGFGTVTSVPIEHPINALYTLEVGA